MRQRRFTAKGTGFLPIHFLAWSNSAERRDVLAAALSFSGLQGDVYVQTTKRRR
jgi:hypothetical protein